VFACYSCCTLLALKRPAWLRQAGPFLEVVTGLPRPAVVVAIHRLRPIFETIYLVEVGVILVEPVNFAAIHVVSVVHRFSPFEFRLPYSLIIGYRPAVSRALRYFFRFFSLRRKSLVRKDLRSAGRPAASKSLIRKDL
jgi:hypothetical protein